MSSPPLAAPSPAPLTDPPRVAWAGLLLAVLGAIAFSGKAIIVKLAYRYGVHAVTLILYRMLFALPMFVALSWWAGRGKPPLSRRDMLTIGGLGFSGYYLSSFLDFAGLAYVTAGLERLILYLNPTIVLVLGFVLYRRTVTPRQLVALAVSYSGVLLVFAHEISLAGSNVALGTALVFASAVSYAVYMVYSGEEVKRLGALRLTGLASTVACVDCQVPRASFCEMSQASEPRTGRRQLVTRWNGSGPSASAPAPARRSGRVTVGSGDGSGPGSPSR